jgi:hypothetical protein
MSNDEEERLEALLEECEWHNQTDCQCPYCTELRELLENQLDEKDITI